jgi:hypothetical protein
MDVRKVMAALPHRYPMLLVDRVERLEPDVRIVATKAVTINEGFFAGHFPGRPIMPGVLIVEALADARSRVRPEALERVQVQGHRPDRGQACRRSEFHGDDRGSADGLIAQPVGVAVTPNSAPIRSASSAGAPSPTISPPASSKTRSNRSSWAKSCMATITVAPASTSARRSSIVRSTQ